jgi:predicted choloylglycine hydrolase
MTPLKTVLLTTLLLVPLTPARAGEDSPAKVERKRADPLQRLRDGLRLWRKESGIERNMVLGQLRGMLAPQPVKADWTPRREGKGRLEQGPGGVPILYLEGTPEEMGHQHGTLLKREIGALRAYVRAFVGKRRLAKATLRAEERFMRHVPKRYIREVRALAAAADLPVKEMFFAQWFADMYRAFACSTLAAPRAKGKGTFLARNLDFPTLGYLQRYSIVVVARPTGQRPFVSVTWPGMVGVLSGQNASLAAAVLVVHDGGGARSGLPFQLAFRKVLEETGDVKAAEALLRKTPITVTNNLMLVDAQGGASVLELHPEEIVARGPRPNGLLVATNHFVSQKRRRDRASFSYLSSRTRYRSVQRTCPAKAPVALETARKALASASVPFTAQSMIFLPAEGALEVAFVQRGAAAKGRFVRIPAKLLLGE